MAFRRPTCWRSPTDEWARRMRSPLRRTSRWSRRPPSARWSPLRRPPVSAQMTRTSSSTVEQSVPDHQHVPGPFTGGEAEYAVPAARARATQWTVRGLVRTTANNAGAWVESLIVGGAGRSAIAFRHAHGEGCCLRDPTTRSRRPHRARPPDLPHGRCHVETAPGTTGPRPPDRLSAEAVRRAAQIHSTACRPTRCRPSARRRGMAPARPGSRPTSTPAAPGAAAYASPLVPEQAVLGGEGPARGGDPRPVRGAGGG